jgi:hypothetical protein
MIHNLRREEEEERGREREGGERRPDTQACTLTYELRDHASSVSLGSGGLAAIASRHEACGTDDAGRISYRECFSFFPPFFSCLDKTARQSEGERKGEADRGVRWLFSVRGEFLRNREW